MGKDIVKYSIQVAMLQQLINEGLVTKKEFIEIKNQLMKKYRIYSDLTS